MSSESYIASIKGAGDGEGDISPAQHQFSEAKGGGFFFFSADMRYMIKTMSYQADEPLFDDVRPNALMRSVTSPRVRRAAEAMQ